MTVLAICCCFSPSNNNGFKLEFYDLSCTVFEIYLHICQLLYAPTSVIHREAIKLPKIEVLTFDRDIMNWRRLWEDYNVYIYSRSQLTDAGTWPTYNNN